jgi:hypothetical protein
MLMTRQDRGKWEPSSNQGIEMQIMLSDFQIALIVLTIDTVAVLWLLSGWYFGIRQKKLRTHHLAVYSVVLVQLFILILWMIPRVLMFLSLGLLNDFAGSWHQIMHDAFGILAVSLGLALVVFSVAKRRLPPALRKMNRLLMRITLVVWVIAFALGIVSFVVGYLV